MSPKRDVPDSPSGVRSEGSASSGRANEQAPEAGGRRSGARQAHENGRQADHAGPDDEHRHRACPAVRHFGILARLARERLCSACLGHNGAASRGHRHEAVHSGRGDRGRADERRSVAGRRRRRRRRARRPAACRSCAASRTARISSLVPNTRWLIASGMAPGSGLHAVDTQAKTRAHDLRGRHRGDASRSHDATRTVPGRSIRSRWCCTVSACGRRRAAATPCMRPTTAAASRSKCSSSTPAAARARRRRGSAAC